VSTKSTIARIGFIATLNCLLIACATHSPAPVVDLYDANFKPLNQSSAEFYLVKPGDTLFSIAWYHSLDHRELAQVNNIKNNRIYPGQKLRLRPAQPSGYFNSESLLMALNREVLRRPVDVDKQLKIASHQQPGSQKSATGKKSRPKASTKARNNNSVKVASVARSKSKSNYSQKSTRSKKQYTSRNKPVKNSNLNWIWPTDGQILERFSSVGNANRGLDIAGKRGQPVRATAPGQVVYKGSGLRGYGNLVIIKHNNDYLSAYAHNETVHVTENEFVKAGQRIADIGRSGAQTDKLHFEIRYKGKPVDPLNYLPQK